MLVSTDGGFGWNTVNSNGLTYPFISYLAVIGTDLFAGTTGGGVFRSTDSGENWTMVNNGLTSNNISSLVSAGNYLYASAGTYPTTQIFYSSDNGANWSVTDSGLPSPNGGILYSIGSNVFTAMEVSGVYLTTNNGMSWTEVNDGFGFSKNFSAFGVLGQDIFVAHMNGNNYRRPISQLITSVDPIPGFQPASFVLFQNYPNPFNPSTKINWQSPASSWLVLKVFDVLGNEIITLVDEYKEAGSYEVKFAAENFSSGIYFYRIQVGSFVETKKMVLLQ